MITERVRAVTAGAYGLNRWLMPNANGLGERGCGVGAAVRRLESTGGGLGARRRIPIDFLGCERRVGPCPGVDGAGIPVPGLEIRTWETGSPTGKVPIFAGIPRFRMNLPD